MKLRHGTIFLLLCVICTGRTLLSAQSAAAEIETLLQTREVTYAQAARFVLEASEANVTADPAEAFRFAAERNWLSKKTNADQTARLDEISLLVMRSFDIKGGIFYSLAKTPHFAYRELVYQGIIQGRVDPSMAVNGDTLLFIINRIYNQQDEEVSIAAERERRRLEAQEAARQRAERREVLAANINTRLRERNITDTSAQATDEGVMLSLTNIQFQADSAELPNSEKRKLEEIAWILSANIPGGRIMVAGHSAMAGTEEGRLRISHERAEAVASYLISLGILEDIEITAAAYGAEMPIADNSTAEGMAANRRVEIIILEN